MSAAGGAQRESVAWSRPALGLAGVALLAFGVRAIGLEWIFVGNDQVVLPLGDAVYQARITLSTKVDAMAAHWAETPSLSA